MSQPLSQQASRACHYCGGPIPDGEKAVQAKTKNAWAHFECWYDGVPFKRDPVTGARAMTGEQK